jgi:carbonic anhydrase
MSEFPSDAFADVLAANERFTESFSSEALTGTARKGLAIVTCMDSRVVPLSIVGMQVGDVKILRNAGARVTDDVLRTLVLATYLLGVNRVLVMPHTNCKMASASVEEIHETLTDAAGMDTRSLDIAVVPDQVAALRNDLVRIRAFPYLPDDLAVAGAIYDVFTGELMPVAG